MTPAAVVVLIGLVFILAAVVVQVYLILKGRPCDLSELRVQARLMEWSGGLFVLGLVVALVGHILGRAGG